MKPVIKNSKAGVYVCARCTACGVRSKRGRTKTEAQMWQRTIL